MVQIVTQRSTVFSCVKNYFTIRSTQISTYGLSGKTDRVEATGSMINDIKGIGAKNEDSRCRNSP